MASARDAITLAASQIGVREAPDGGTKFHDWYGAPHSWAWCCIFQSWVQVHLGMPVGPLSGRGSAWVSGFRDWYARDDSPGEVLSGTRDARPGDLCCFEWGTTPGGYDHIGMVEAVEDQYLVTIEGNTQNAVQRHRRARYGAILELLRPAYELETPPTTEDDDVKAERLMIRDTRPGRKGATYLTTVLDNGEGHEPRLVGIGVGSLLSNGDQVAALQRAGIRMLDVGDSDPYSLLTLGVLPDALDYPLP